MPFDLHGQQRFLQLAAESLVGREKEDAAQLLGDGAGALVQTPSQNVHQGGASHPAYVHSPMVPKVAVLDREDRVLQKYRNPFVVRQDAALKSKGADQRALPPVDFRDDVRPIVFEQPHLRQIDGVDKDEAAERTHPHRKQQKDEKHHLSVSNLSPGWRGIREVYGKRHK